MIEPYAGLIRSTKPPAAWRNHSVADFLVNGFVLVIVVGLLACLLLFLASDSGLLRCDAPAQSDSFEICVDERGNLTT